MKTNYWLILGTMLATSAVAQVNTNSLPAIPAPATTATPEPVVAPAITETTSPAPVAPVKKKAPAKKRVVKKIYEPTITLNPGNATVIAENLNMRGQAGMKGEVLGHLNMGQTVTVISQINLDKHALDEPAQWVKIALPSGTKVWVSSQFIDKTARTVTARKLNLRSGPGENYSVLGVLEKGATVNEVSTKGTWTEIEAPSNAYAFVAAMFLKQEAAAPAPEVAANAPAPAPEATPAPAPTPATTVAEAEPVAAPQPATAPVAAATPAAQQGSITAPVVEMAPAPVIDTNPPPPRVVSHQGFVRGSTSPVAPTYYELYDPKTQLTINYLYSPTTNLNLARYDGANIIVTGQESMADRWPSTPVLTIQKIYVVDATPVEPYKRLATPRASEQDIRGTKPKQSRR